MYHLIWPYLQKSSTNHQSQLSKINLSQNKIGPKLNVWPDLSFKTQAQKLIVDLSKNGIKYINYTSLFESEERLKTFIIPGSSQNIEIDVSENLLQCDCQNFDLFRHLDSLTPDRQFKKSRAQSFEHSIVRKGGLI